MSPNVIILVDVLIHPRSALAEISKDPATHRSIGIGLLIFSILFSFVLVSEPKLLFSNVNTPLIESIAIVMLYLIGKKLDGKAKFLDLVAIMGHASLPQILGFILVPIFVIAASYGNLVSLDFDDFTVYDYFLLNEGPRFFESGLSEVLIWEGFNYSFLIWSLILGIIALKEIHQFTIAKSIITIILAVIISSVVFSAFWFFAILAYPLLLDFDLGDEIKDSTSQSKDPTVGIKVRRDMTDMAFNYATDKLYTITGQYSSADRIGLLVIDGSKRELTHQIELSGLPTSVAVNPSTNLIYVGRHGEPNSYKGYVDVIDGFSFQTLSSIAVGDGPTDIEVNTNNNMIYVANHWSNSVSVIDGSEHKVLKTITVSTNPTDITINSRTNKIYVSTASARGVPYDGEVVVIDGDSLEVSSVIGIERRPYLIDVNPRTSMVYVGSADYGFTNSSGIISVIEGDSNAILKTIEIVGQPIGLTVDPASNKVYVSIYAHTVSVIDGQTNLLIKEINLEDQPAESSIIVNSNSGLVYLGTHDSKSIRVINGTTDTLIEFEKPYPYGRSLN